MVFWLRFCASNAGSMGLIPVGGTQIPHVVWYGQLKKKLPNYLLLFSVFQYVYLMDHGYDLNQWGFPRLVTIWRYLYGYYIFLCLLWNSLVAQRLKRPPAMQETWVRSLGWEDPLEKEMATHSSSCLENPMDGGAWWATVHRVAKSRTWLSNFTNSWNY